MTGKNMIGDVFRGTHSFPPSKNLNIPRGTWPLLDTPVTKQIDTGMNVRVWHAAAGQHVGRDAGFDGPHTATELEESEPTASRTSKVRKSPWEMRRLVTQLRSSLGREHVVFFKAIVQLLLLTLYFWVPCLTIKRSLFPGNIWRSVRPATRKTMDLPGWQEMLRWGHGRRRMS